MSELNDMLATLAGERPVRFPYTPMGHWNRKACENLLPPGCFDDNIYSLPRERYGSEPRSEKSREVAVNYARFMQVSTLGCGKGGAMPFGHGGPAEIIGDIPFRGRQQAALLFQPVLREIRPDFPDPGAGRCGNPRTSRPG